MFKQTVKAVENHNSDVAGVDMSYDETKVMCTEEWKDEDCNCLYLDRSKKENEV